MDFSSGGHRSLILLHRLSNRVTASICSQCGVHHGLQVGIYSTIDLQRLQETSPWSSPWTLSTLSPSLFPDLGVCRAVSHSMLSYSFFNPFLNVLLQRCPQCHSWALPCSRLELALPNVGAFLSLFTETLSTPTTKPCPMNPSPSPHRTWNAHQAES